MNRLFWLVKLLIIYTVGLTSIGAKECDVTEVIDGDTVIISCSGESVTIELYGIDAPEVSLEGVNDDCETQPWGNISKRSLDGLLNIMYQAKVNVTKIKKQGERTEAVLEVIKEIRPPMESKVKLGPLSVTNKSSLGVSYDMVSSGDAFALASSLDEEFKEAKSIAKNHKRIISPAALYKEMPPVCQVDPWKWRKMKKESRCEITKKCKDWMGDRKLIFGK